MLKEADVIRVKSSPHYDELSVAKLLKLFESDDKLKRHLPDLK